MLVSAHWTKLSKELKNFNQLNIDLDYRAYKYNKQLLYNVKNSEMIRFDDNISS